MSPLALWGFIENINKHKILILHFKTQNTQN
jgi:hypothetical protein